jgi:LmbE family N-acetylglucosaminyl deacetylase
MMERILFVGAHHDDLELAMGGTVKRWTMEGKKVVAAMLTNSQWSAPGGQLLRDPARVIADCEQSAALLGFEPFHLDLSDATNISFADAHVVKVLGLISAMKIDTLVTIWEHDAHPAHQATSAIAMAATRKVPNVLTVRLSWNSVPQAWNPNFFVDVTATLEYRIAALQCYQDEWKRTGTLWEKYIRGTAALYGLQCGCEAAEGFEVVKLCM